MILDHLDHLDHLIPRAQKYFRNGSINRKKSDPSDPSDPDFDSTEIATGGALRYEIRYSIM